MCEPEDCEDKHPEQEPEIPHDSVLGEGFLEREGVVQVSGVAGCAVETEGAAGELGSCAGVVGFGELDGLVGAAVREAVDEDVAAAEA